MTVLEVIQRSSEFLAKKCVESPRLQIELLLAHLLGLPRMQLYLNFERVLTVAELNTLRALVRRRGQREPLQHIIGSAPFCGFELAVNRHALIPRPETELLAERSWQFLNQLSTLNYEPRTALDFGTGSGCLAIALALKCPIAQLWATDVSNEALELAHRNAARHNVAARIQFLLGDGFDALADSTVKRWGERPRGSQAEVQCADSPVVCPHESGFQFDLIVANPPYIPSAAIDSLAPEVREHDPRLALDGGADGLDFYRRLALEASEYLQPNGRIMLELGDGQAGAVRETFDRQKWVVEAIQEDYSRQPRILVARPAG